MSIGKRVATILFVGYIGALLTLLLWPRGEDVTHLNDEVYLFFLRRGFPESLGPEFYGFAFNVLFFVPPALFAAYLSARAPWWIWVVAGVAISVAVELTQAIVLLSRTPSLIDVAANTLGAAVGALIGAAVRRWGGRRRLRRDRISVPE